MLEDIIDSLLRETALTSVVGQKIALYQLPQGSDYPAVVYSIISNPGIQHLCVSPTTARARIQINPLAKTMGQVNDLHVICRSLLESDSAKIEGGIRMISCRFDSFGPATKDEFTGMWTKPADYILIHEMQPTGA